MDHKLERPLDEFRGGEDVSASLLTGPDIRLALTLLSMSRNNSPSEVVSPEHLAAGQLLLMRYSSGLKKEEVELLKKSKGEASEIQSEATFPGKTNGQKTRSERLVRSAASPYPDPSQRPFARTNMQSQSLQQPKEYGAAYMGAVERYLQPLESVAEKDIASLPLNFFNPQAQTQIANGLMVLTRSFNKVDNFHQCLDGLSEKYPALKIYIDQDRFTERGKNLVVERLGHSAKSSVFTLFTKRLTSSREGKQSMGRSSGRKM